MTTIISVYYLQRRKTYYTYNLQQQKTKQKTYNVLPVSYRNPSYLNC